VLTKRAGSGWRTYLKCHASVIPKNTQISFGYAMRCYFASFHPEMALFRNICVNLRVCLFPHVSGTRNPLIFLIFQKIAHL
jgi:hypothetical protein